MQCTEHDNDNDLNEMREGFEDQQECDRDAWCLYWGSFVWRWVCWLLCAVCFGFAAGHIYFLGYSMEIVGGFLGMMVAQGCATKTHLAKDLWRGVSNIIVDSKLEIAQEDGEDFYFLTVNCDVYRLLRYNPVTKLESGSIAFVTVSAKEDDNDPGKPISSSSFFAKVGQHNKLTEEPYKTGWVHPVRDLDTTKQYILEAQVTLYTI